MEGLTRLVSESLVRHGLDRPVDYRRLRWSRWFRCESHHSLLQVPSQAGVVAIAEEVMDFADGGTAAGHVGTAALGCPTEPVPARRMLAVTHFFEDDDMAFVLDRMLTRENPLRPLLNSGRCFLRFVVIEDRFQRRSICQQLVQWLANSSEKASGIGSHFAASLELDSASMGRTPAPHAATTLNPRPATEAARQEALPKAPPGDSRTAQIHFPSSFFPGT